MFRPRVIPCLLLKNKGLVKTVNFKNPKYIGDPMNAIKIFNELKADELIFLDIEATANKSKPNLELISNISLNCDMPFAVGGGIRTIEDVKDIINSGAEKVCINTYAVENPDFISQVADKFGNQSVVVSIDVKKKLFGKYEVVTKNASTSTGLDPVSFAKLAEQKGAGEIMITSVNSEGTMKGYDINLIKSVSDAVSIPVIAHGGAGNIHHLSEAVSQGNASAVAAGSMFIYHGPHNAVLINFPSNKELNELFIQD